MWCIISCNYCTVLIMYSKKIMKIENFMKKILSISPYSFSHTQIISIFAAQLTPLLT